MLSTDILDPLTAGDREFTDVFTTCNTFPKLRDVDCLTPHDGQHANADVAIAFFWMRNGRMARASVSWDRTGQELVNRLVEKAMLDPADTIRFHDGDAFPLDQTFDQMRQLLTFDYASKRKDIVLPHGGGKRGDRTHTGAFLLELDIQQDPQIVSTDSENEKTNSEPPKLVRVMPILKSAGVCEGMVPFFIIRQGDNRQPRHPVVKLQCVHDATFFEVLRFGERLKKIPLIRRAILAMHPHYPLETKMGEILLAPQVMNQDEIEINLPFPPHHPADSDTSDEE